MLEATFQRQLENSSSYHEVVRVLRKIRGLSSNVPARAMKFTGTLIEAIIIVAV